MSLDNVVPEAQVWSYFAGGPSSYGKREVRGVVQHQKRRWTVRTVVVVNAVAVVLVALIMVNAPPAPINAVLVTLEAENYTVHQL